MITDNETGKRKIDFSPPDISDLEIAEVSEALRSGWITTGPRTKELERRLAAYVGVPEAAPNMVCLNSATAAEELSLRVLGVGPGDEVLVPAYTYTATASAAIHVGAIVKFIDSQPDSCEMDYDQMEAAITEKTKAIVPVDLGGVMCDYDRIYQAVENKRDLFRPGGNTDLGRRIQKSLGRIAVVADCAHALGAWRKLYMGDTSGSGTNTQTDQTDTCIAKQQRLDGNMDGLSDGRSDRMFGMTVAATQKCRIMAGNAADFTSFSFHAVKNFTTAEGGAAAWRHIEGIDDNEIYHMYQLLSLHGQSKDALAKTKLGAWEYDIVAPFYKCNMTDIMAALGLKQLERYPGLLARRREIIEKYDGVCDSLGISHLVHSGKDFCGSGHLYLARIPGISVEQRNAVITEMAERGIACNVHYKPLPMMTAYKKLGWNIADFPNAYQYYANEVTLPLHTRLTDEDVKYVSECFRETVEEVTGRSRTDAERLGKTA